MRLRPRDAFRYGKVEEIRKGEVGHRRGGDGLCASNKKTEDDMHAAEETLRGETDADSEGYARRGVLRLQEKTFRSYRAT